jgi:hypothetical protein
MKQPVNHQKVHELRELLSKSHKNKNKAELIETIHSLQSILASEEIPSEMKGLLKIDEEVELEELKNDELVKIIETTSVKTVNELLKMEFPQTPVPGPLKSQPSTSFTAELNNINFESLIGGPLQAAVTAQTDASIATLDFIRSVGFTYDESDEETITGIRKVEFMYEKSGGFNEDGTPEDPECKTIQVPFLTMLSIPSLRIDYVDIDFNVKLNSVETAETKTDFAIDSSTEFGRKRIKIKASVAFRRSSVHNVKVEKEYALNVKVRAVQDEMPAGLEKILNLLAA